MLCLRPAPHIPLRVVLPVPPVSLGKVQTGLRPVTATECWYKIARAPETPDPKKFPKPYDSGDFFDTYRKLIPTAYYDVQSSISRFSIRLNSRTLFVTSVNRRLAAMEAIMRSFGPIAFPCFSNALRIRPYTSAAASSK